MKKIIENIDSKISNLKISKNFNGVFSSFSYSEKFFFKFLLLVLLVSAIGILISINNKHMTMVPTNGGSLKEGVIGTPRFINPLLATSNADRDLNSLIYSGLTKITGNGNVVVDLAESYEISPDGLEYTFHLKPDLEFHDGKPVTTEDIVFTILKVQDPRIRSQKQADWEGIIIDKVSDRTVVFKLRQPYSQFLENASIGILPKHLWSEASSEEFSLNKLNSEPVGSGPYKLSSIKRDSNDIPTSYILKSFGKYALGKPFIDNFILKFAKNENELVSMFKDGQIDSINGISPKVLSELPLDKFDRTSLSLPRIFTIFLNQGETPVLSNKSVRQALELSAPKDQIVEDIFYGFAEVADSPIPNHLQPTRSSELLGTKSTENKISEAQKVLEADDWQKNDEGIYTKVIDDERVVLAFSLSTSNVPELVEVAEQTVEAWNKVGMQVDLKVFEVSDVNQNVIRPRNFESLLFGMIVNDDLDFYAFWHSSQRNDPGLNITNYANITVDSLLEELRQNLDKDNRKTKLLEFESEVRNDLPAIFIYTPQFVYLTSKKINGVDVQSIKTADNRFQDIHKWSIKTDKVWKIFNR